GACPDWENTATELTRMDVHGPEIQRLIATLVERHVAITSTLPVFESFSGSRIPKLDDRAPNLLAPELRIVYMAQKDLTSAVRMLCGAPCWRRKWSSSASL